MSRLLRCAVSELVSWRAVFYGASLLFFQSTALFCQSTSASTPATRGSATSSYHPHLTFDVASIREYRSDGGMRYVDNMPHNSRYHGEGVGLVGLILGAYDIKVVQQMENLPRWGFDTMYMIDAKSDDATDEALAKLSDDDARAEKRHMLQALLAERFHLKIHAETRTSKTYELITTAKTAKLMTEVHGDLGKTINTCTAHFSKLKGAEIDSTGCPFHILFSALEQDLGTDVLDRTGMTGVNAFHLMWLPTRFTPPQDGQDRYPALTDAVREQLGLELKATKGPVTFWVVDQVERPTPN